jgi:hypothetical protein
MRLEDTTVTIEPRSAGACLDLALVFYRHHARSLLVVTLLFAVPSSLLAAFLAAAAGANGALWTGLWFFLTAPLLGAVVVSGAGRAVFGERLEPMDALRGLSGVWGPLLLSILATRLVVLVAGLVCLVPGLFVDAYYGFHPELIVLEGLRGESARRRIQDLTTSSLGGTTFLALFARKLTFLLFMLGAAVAVFTLVEQGIGLLLGQGLVSGRIDPRFLRDSLERLLADPYLMALLTGTVWLVYPVARLAWFFSYLDVRIRKEGWDLELDFRVEAHRIEVVA